MKPKTKPKVAKCNCTHAKIALSYLFLWDRLLWLRIGLQ